MDNILDFPMTEEEKNKLVEILNTLKGNRSQRQFAIDLGVTPYVLNTWFHKISSPNRDNLKIIADYMNISFDQLLCLIQDTHYSSAITIENATVAYQLLRDLPKIEKIKLIKLLLDDV